MVHGRGGWMRREERRGEDSIKTNQRFKELVRSGVKCLCVS